MGHLLVGAETANAGDRLTVPAVFLPRHDAANLLGNSNQPVATMSSLGAPPHRAIPPFCPDSQTARGSEFLTSAPARSTISSRHQNPRSNK